MTMRKDQKIREQYGDVVVASPSESIGQPMEFAREPMKLGLYPTCRTCSQWEERPSEEELTQGFGFCHLLTGEIANDVFICGHDFGCNRHSERVANWCCPRKYPLHEDGCKNKAQATDTTNYAGKAAQDAPPAPREPNWCETCRSWRFTDGDCGRDECPRPCQPSPAHEALIALVQKWRERSGTWKRAARDERESDNYRDADLSATCAARAKKAS